MSHTSRTLLLVLLAGLSGISTRADAIPMPPGKPTLACNWDNYDQYYVQTYFNPRTRATTYTTYRCNGQSWQWVSSYTVPENA